jgi:hypothetical protein
MGDTLPLSRSKSHNILLVITCSDFRFIFTMPLIKNKKFWEELITYFLWYDVNRIQHDASNNSSIVECVLVAGVKFLPSRCLATLGRYTYRQTDERDLWSTPLIWAHVPWHIYQVSAFKNWQGGHLDTQTAWRYHMPNSISFFPKHGK